MSGIRREELNDQAGTFVDLVLKNEVSGGELKAASTGLSYSDEQVHSFLLSIEEHIVKGQPAGLILAEEQLGLLGKIKKELNNPVFHELKKVLQLFRLTIDETEENKKHVNQAEIKKINSFLNKNNQNIIFALQMNSLHEESLIFKELSDLKTKYHSKQVIVQSPRLIDTPKPVSSSTAQVLAGTQSASSSVVPLSTAKKVNFFKALPSLRTNINIENVAYEFKFDEQASASSVKVDMYKVGQAAALGSFVIAQDKIIAYKMTVEIAVAMMKAYMTANPGEHMEIKPKDKAAYGFFVEAAKHLKNDLDKINYTINAVDGLEKVDVRADKEQAPKMKMPNPNLMEERSPGDHALVDTSSNIELISQSEVPGNQEALEGSNIADSSYIAPSVPTSLCLSGEESPPKSLADGNCLFNSFALGLLEINNRKVGVSPALKDFINDNQDIFSSNPNAFQKQLAPKLRELSCDLSRQNYDNNSYQLQDALWAQYYQDKSTENSDDDIFSPHDFIQKKFKEKELTYEELCNWWSKDGYRLFLDEMEKDGCWAGDLELKELAIHFSINLNIVDSNSQDKRVEPVEHLYAMKLDTTQLGILGSGMLVQLGVILEWGKDNLSPLALNSQQLKKTLENIEKLKNSENLKNIKHLIDGKDLKNILDLINSDTFENSAELIKTITNDLISCENECMELGIFSKNDNGIVDEPIDIARRYLLYLIIHDQLVQLNHELGDKPVISLEHSGKHWDIDRKSEALKQKINLSP